MGLGLRSQHMGAADRAAGGAGRARILRGLQAVVHIAQRLRRAFAVCRLGERRFGLAPGDPGPLASAVTLSSGLSATNYPVYSESGRLRVFAAAMIAF